MIGKKNATLCTSATWNRDAHVAHQLGAALTWTPGCKRQTNHGCMFGPAGPLLPRGGFCRARLRQSPGKPHVCHAAGARSSSYATGSHRPFTQVPKCCCYHYRTLKGYADQALNGLAKPPSPPGRLATVLCQTSHTSPHTYPRSCTSCHTHRGCSWYTCANTRLVRRQHLVGAGPQW